MHCSLPRAFQPRAGVCCPGTGHPLPLQRPRLRRSMQGVTLVGLMVGLVISMLVVVGMMTVFRTVVQATLQSRQTAAEDDRRVSALMRMALHLQDAGFGLQAPAYGAQLLVLSGASLALASDGTYRLSGTRVEPDVENAASNAVLWAYDLSASGTVQCAGFVYEAADNAAARLVYLAPANCSGVALADLSTLAWTRQTWLQGSKAEPVPSLHFALRTGECRPFGIGGGRGGLVLRVLSARSGDSSSSAMPVEAAQCLLNFPAPAAAPPGAS